MKNLFIAFLGVFLFISCSSDDNISQKKYPLKIENNKDLKRTIDNMENYYYSSLKKIRNNSLDPNKNNNVFEAFYQNNSFLKEVDSNKLEFIESMISTKDYISIFNSMSLNGYIDEKEKNLLLQFTEEASAGNKIEEVVLKYKSIFIENNLYDKYESFFIGFHSLNSNYSTLFINSIGGSGYQTRGFFSSCAGASVGLALGFAGLVVGGASVAGAGIGAAAFIYASMQWGDACR